MISNLETTWTIPLQNGQKIYGVLNAPATVPSRLAIFIVHGLTGHIHEYAFKRAADYFSKAYDVYRIQLYGEQQDARNLVDCTIQTHADDLNQVLQHFSHGYDEIFLIGHSYGGTTVMLANSDNVTAVSLWDPTFNLPVILSEFKETYLESTGFYIVEWGTTSFISRDMYQEAQRLDTEACCALARQYHAPVQVIHAGNGLFVHDSFSYHSFGDARNIREIVDGTMHCFHEGTTCEELLQKTEKWFKSFSQGILE